MESKIPLKDQKYFVFLIDVTREKMLLSLNLPYNSETKQPVFPDDPKSRSVITSHGSANVLGHSLWTALYVQHFFDTKSRWVQGLSPELTIICGFFHDIAKASNCGLSCNPETGRCFLNVYSPLNYEGKGDQVHPEVGGKVVLGEQHFWFQCPISPEIDLTQWKKEHPESSILYPHTFFTWIKTDYRIVALTAFTHWEIGKINAASNKEVAIDAYLKLFVSKCKQVNLSPTLSLLQMCIVIAFADILAGSLEEFRLKNPFIDLSRMLNDLKKYKFFQLLLRNHSVPVAKVNSYYTSSNPWRLYKMDQQADIIFDAVLRTAKSKAGIYDIYL